MSTSAACFGNTAHPQLGCETRMLAYKLNHLHNFLKQVLATLYCSEVSERHILSSSTVYVTFSWFILCKNLKISCLILG